PGRRLPDLGDRALLRLPGGQPPVQVEAGLVRDGAERRRGGLHLGDRDRALPEERVRAQPLVQLLDLERDAGDLVDGVVPALGRRAVAAAPLDLDADLHAAPVAAVDVEVRGLGDHDELRPDAVLAEDVLPAQAVAVLLHDRPGEVDRELVVQAELLDDPPRMDHRRDAALLVDRAAAPDLPAHDLPLERVEAPLRAVARVDRVHVPVERDHPPARADAADDVAEAVDADPVEADPL